MVTFIILISLIVLSIIGIKKNPYSGYVLLLPIIASVLLCHSIGYFTAGYDYGIYVARRDAFEETLKEARENGCEYEIAAITKEVVEWNQSLAEKKYDNKTIIFDQYIDDRIELLEPIK